MYALLGCVIQGPYPDPGAPTWFRVPWLGEEPSKPFSSSLSWPVVVDLLMTPLDVLWAPLNSCSFPFTLPPPLGPWLQKAHQLVKLLEL